MGKENQKKIMANLAPSPSIQMVDLRKQYLRIKNEIDTAIEKVLLSTAFIQGKEVADFAQDLKQYTGAGYVIP
ncbi:MAG: hypothetical protein ACK57K_04145, partial [Chryseotalea sp.]